MYIKNNIITDIYINIITYKKYYKRNYKIYHVNNIIQLLL